MFVRFFFFLRSRIFVRCEVFFLRSSMFVRLSSVPKVFVP